MLTHRDIVGLVLSYLYAFGLLFVVEAVGRRLKWQQFLTRKLVHVGAGMWVWGIIGLFDTWTIGIIPFATFIVLNYVFYRYRVFGSMDAVDSSPGTVYFAISITLLYALLWRPLGPADHAPVAVGAVMAMTWGDGLASIVGQSWGKRFYTVSGNKRSWEGSAAMWAAAFASIFLTLLLLPGSTWSPFSAPIALGRAFLVALIGSTVATAAEGLSPSGIDNLTVPLLTGPVLFLLLAA